jgi:hypothetical protein
MYYMNEEFPMWVQQREIVTTPTDERQRLVVLGDSRAKSGFKPSLSEIHTINLSLGGISPVGGYYLLGKYLDVAPAPEKLVLSFSPFVLHDQDDFRQVFWDRPVRFSLLERDDLEEIFQNAERLGDTSFGDLRWHGLRFASPDKSFGDLLAGSFIMRRKENRKIYRQVRDQGGHVFFGTENGSSEPFTEARFDEFRVSEMLEFYLHETIRLAKRNDIDVYWYSMPFNNSSIEALHPAFMSGFDAFLATLSRRGDITVINGISFMDDAEFGDPSHVYHGVQKVTLDLLSGAGLLADDS